MPRGSAPGERRGGRKKGTANKRTKVAQDISLKALSSGLTPLEYMLNLLRDESQKQDVRLDAAKSAAPYVHPKLSNIEQTGKDGGPEKKDITVRYVDGS